MVFWINNPFDTLPGEGGRPMRYWLLARAMVAKGHEVVFWSSDFHHVTKTRRELPQVYAADGFQVRLIPTPRYRSNVGVPRILSHWSYARRWRATARAAVAARETREPDCILVSLPPLDLYAAAAALRRQWHCHVLVDIQDAWPETFHRLLPRSLRGLAHLFCWPARRMARRAFREADGISAVTRRYLKLADVPGRRTEAAVFPLGSLLAQARMASKPVTWGDELRLCYVGNLGASYDINTMIEGVRRLSAQGCRISLSVMGDGPRRGLLASAMSAGTPIQDHGYQPQTAVQACLESSDVGIVPMFAASWVAVPNKVVDYAAAGLAIVNGLQGETQALLERYDAGLTYTAGSAASLAATLRRYVEDRALLARHQLGARRMAEKEFDAARIYPEMAAWIVRTCASASA